MWQIFSNVVFQTVLAGTLVFVLGQIIQKSIIDVYYVYRGVIARIDNRLRYHLKIIKNPGKDTHTIERLQTASQEFLQLSADLASCRKQMIFRSRKMDEKVSEASMLLYGLHIEVFLREDHGDKNFEKLARIRDLLNLP